MFYKNKKSGFTLVEVLISMTIFVVFMGLLINSYTNIIREQRDANIYRAFYSEARTVFDTLTNQVRDNVLYYPVYEDGTQMPIVSPVSELVLVDKESLTPIKFSHVDSKKICFGSKDGAYYLNENVVVEAFNIFVTPVQNPYFMSNVTKDYLQFQPKVTIFARFSGEAQDGEKYEIDLHTTISSRSYGDSEEMMQSINPETLLQCF